MSGQSSATAGCASMENLQALGTPVEMNESVWLAEPAGFTGDEKRTAGRSAADYMPATRSLQRLREAAARCRGCDLYRGATQTVFGEGKAGAKIMLVGEQPGDAEDIAGHPFVGPSGKLLSRASDSVGISAPDVYVTNVVKHFKYIWRGKRRIHAKPKRIEVQACSPWLEAEIHAVRPQLVVALGATAARELLGAKFKLSQQRGRVFPSAFAPRVIATVHPSSILRSTDAQERHANMALPRRPPRRRIGLSACVELASSKPGSFTSTIRANDSSIALINTLFASPERADELLQPEVAPHVKRAAEIAERFDPMLYHVAYVDDRAEG